MSPVARAEADRSGPFRPAVVIGLIVAAVFAMSGMAVLSAWAPELSRGDDGRDHALSRSGVGYAATVRLLRATGRPVLLSRGRISQEASQANLLVLTPPDGRDEKALTALRRHEGPKLIVLPKWRTASDPVRPGWVRRVGLMPERQVLAALPRNVRSHLTLTTASGVERPRLMGLGERFLAQAGPIEQMRTLSGRDWTPLVHDQQGRAVILANVRQDLYVLADPDFLNTQGMKDPAKARAALALIDEAAVGADGVIFDLTLHGFSRPRSVLRLLMEPPMLGFTLCLFFAALLVGWQSMIRFEPHGQGGRAVAPGKRALADNTAALARLARREHRMAAPYADLVRTLAARAVAAPLNLSADALTALLNRLAARRGGETFESLKARAEAAKSPADLMAVARALNDWKAEMTRGRG